jgi:predicted nucleotidyltransferase
MVLDHLNIDQKKLDELCRRNGVASLSIFGSALREEFRIDSDIDLLVEFKPERHASLFDLGGMLMELQDLLGREVDLRTKQDLSPYFRDDVVRSARLLYTDLPNRVGSASADRLFVRQMP